MINYVCALLQSKHWKRNKIDGVGEQNWSNNFNFLEFCLLLNVVGKLGPKDKFGINKLKYCALIERVFPTNCINFYWRVHKNLKHLIGFYVNYWTGKSVLAKGLSFMFPSKLLRRKEKQTNKIRYLFHESASNSFSYFLISRIGHLNGCIICEFVLSQWTIKSS